MYVNFFFNDTVDEISFTVFLNGNYNVISIFILGGNPYTHIRTKWYEFESNKFQLIARRYIQSMATLF